MGLSVPFDRDVPLLIAKMGRYPVHHGGLGLARSIGRLGVPVVAMVEDRGTTLAVSRFVRWRVPALGVGDDAAWVAEVFAGIARRLGQRPVCVATDDEIAILLAEDQTELGRWVRLCEQPDAGLPRRLNDKAELASLCVAHGVGSPFTCAPASREEVEEFARSAVFPVVMKNRAAYSRVSNPAIPGTVVVSDVEQLMEWARGFDASRPVVLQEFIPRGRRVNWIYQAYRSADGQRILSFTGIKQRDWPSGRGETTMALSVSQPGLKSTLDSFLQAIDYRGVCGLDVVQDLRTGRYSVIDFNPRFGANAGLFVTAEGLSLVGAYHRDLTGREFQIGQQVDGRSFQVEPRDRLARRQDTAGGGARRGHELAYLARDDPAPMIVERLRTTIGAGRARISPWWSNNAR